MNEAVCDAPPRLVFPSSVCGGVSAVSGGSKAPAWCQLGLSGEISRHRTGDGSCKASNPSPRLRGRHGWAGGWSFAPALALPDPQQPAGSWLAWPKCCGDFSMGKTSRNPSCPSLPLFLSTAYKKKKKKLKISIKIFLGNDRRRAAGGTDVVFLPALLTALLAADPCWQRGDKRPQPGRSHAVPVPSPCPRTSPTCPGLGAEPGPALSGGVTP